MLEIGMDDVIWRSEIISPLLGFFLLCYCDGGGFYCGVSLVAPPPFFHFRIFFVNFGC